jgi:hypothetical protein
MDNPEKTFTYCLCPVSCVCCMCLWIVHYWLPLRLSLTFTYYLYTVSCVFNVVCVSGLSIIGSLFGSLEITEEETYNGQSRDTYNIHKTQDKDNK